MLRLRVVFFFRGQRYDVTVCFKDFWICSFLWKSISVFKFMSGDMEWLRIGLNCAGGIRAFIKEKTVNTLW